MIFSSWRFLFHASFITHSVTVRDRKSRGFNRLAGTSQKPIMHSLQSLYFFAAALNVLDIPWWITTKWEREKRREEIQEDFYALIPWGRSVCWWSGVRFSGKHISSLPPTPSLKANQVPAEEFLHPARARVLSCTTHLLLIKQRQALKMLVYRDCGDRAKENIKKSQRWSLELQQGNSEAVIVFECDLLLFYMLFESNFVCFFRCFLVADVRYDKLC